MWGYFLKLSQVIDIYYEFLCHKTLCDVPSKSSKEPAGQDQRAVWAANELLGICSALPREYCSASSNSYKLSCTALLT